MSRLRRLLGSRAGAFALAALIAWALARPLLSALGLRQEEGTAILLALAASGLISLYTLLPGRFRGLLPLGLGALLVLMALGMKGSFPARAWALVRSLRSGATPRDAVRLYFDALLPILMLLLALYARLMMEGEPAFSIPLLVTPLMMLWFLGARESMLLYFPAAACLPLLYAYSTRDAGREALQGHGKAGWLRVPAVALALTLVAFALTPSYRQTMPEAERMADSLRRAIEDTFFFTDTRSMFSLASQGYQPMGERGLGGSPDISLSPVMTVTAEEKVYLRGTALDLYSGRAWFDTLSNERYSWSSVRFAGLRGSLFNEGLPVNDRVETRSAGVTLMNAMPSTLFVPQRLRGVILGGGMVVYFNASSELFITHDLISGDNYSFRYEPYIAGERRTDALAAKLAGEGYVPMPELPAEYVQLPAHLDRDGLVSGLAREIAGDIADPYLRGLELMRYLKGNYGYSLDVPDAPENLDFVSHFLFDVREGYCTYFASAMTVLARSLGLPARYVEGFLAIPGDAGSVTLTGMNAHAWTEIYIQGMGWVTFDATAGEGEDNQGGGEDPPPSRPPEPSPSPSPSPSPEPSSEPSAEPDPGDAPSPSPLPDGNTPTPEPQPQEQRADPLSPPGSRFPWWILLLLALAALLIWRAREEAPERREKRMGTPGEVLKLYWAAMLEARAARGEGIKPHETPIVYAFRLDAGDAGLNRLAGAQSALVYGREAPDRDVLSLARAQYTAVWRSLPWYKKAPLSLRRALRPLAVGARKAPRLLWGAVRKKLFRGTSGRKPMN